MIRKVLLFVLVGLFVNPIVFADEPLASLTTKGDYLRFFTELGLDFQFSTPPVDEIQNLSESIRNVPPHPDDNWSWYATPGPIKKDTADAPSLLEIRFLKAGIETDLGESVTWRNYADLSFNYNYYFRWGADTHERNYTNYPDTDKRGYGAALTFWTPAYDPLIYGFKSEINVKSKDKKKENESWFVGIGYRSYNLGVITGYDRYDRMDYKSFTRIGKISETSIYFGGKEDDPKDRFFNDFRVGINLNNYKKGNKYRDTNVDMEDISFFVSFSFGWKF